jgi:hypothetical protein
VGEAAVQIEGRSFASLTGVAGVVVVDDTPYVDQTTCSDAVESIESWER